MLFSQLTTEIGEVNSITIDTDYVAEPLKLFTELSKYSNECLLLESAEIDSKDDLKSLMLVDAAVRFECNGNQVTVAALENNGQPVVQHLFNYFEDCEQNIDANLVDSNTLIVTFNELEIDIDEDSRLKQKNTFEALRVAVNNIKANSDSTFSLFLGGVFSYDMLANYEQLPEVPTGVNSCPDYLFYLAETVVIVDHQTKHTELLGNVFSGTDAYANCFTVGKKLETINNIIKQVNKNDSQKEFGFKLAPVEQVTVNIDDATFEQQVSDLKENIIKGDVFQIVPSRCFSLPCNDSLDAYRHLKQDNPSPYMFYLKANDFVLFGASPESALKYCSQENLVEVYPIAGTRKRGFNADGSINLDLDSRIELDLRADKKEVAEHIMLVDLARNDVARIAQTGSRHTKELLKVDRYSYVMHLVSRVVGQLREDLDALHAYQACMNMGTLVGAPKIKAASLIRETEGATRGSYGGAVGYLTGNGDMDTCIVIRSAFVKDGMAHIQAGAGVVYDSCPKSESQETKNKAQAVIRAVNASQSLANQMVS